MAQQDGKAGGDYEGAVLFGFPRSGTTLTRRILTAHPTISCPPETYLLRSAARFIEEQPAHRGLSVGVLSGCAYAGIEPDDMVGRIRDLVFGAFREIAHAEGKKRWVDKNGFNMFRIDAIERICGPRCRYICLVRHPLDVICSVRELCNHVELFQYELHEYVRIHPSPLVAFAHAWADTYARLLKFEEDHPTWCMRLKYEDLTADAPGQLQRIMDFLGEPGDAEAIVQEALVGHDKVGMGDWKTYTKKTITTSSVGRHSELSPQTIAKLTEIVGPVMERYGYERPEVTQVAEGEEARHHLQLGLMASKLLAGRAKKDGVES